MPNRRRRGRLLAAVVAAIVLAVVGGVFAWSRLGPGATPTSALGAPGFAEETSTSGIEHVYDGTSTFYTGGGVAAFDCDDDGRPELYLAGGANPAALYRNTSRVGGPLRFAAIADPLTDVTGVTGAYPLDIDADGRLDLAILRVGEDVLLRGLGDCRFERANEAWRFDGGDRWTTAFSATWEGSAALPTLAVGHYLALEADGSPTSDCTDHELLRPDPSGAAFAGPIPLAPGYCTLSMLFSDWDRSGRRDLRISNDRQYYRDGGEQLWRMEPGTAPRLYTDADGWVLTQVWGMGIASHDVTADGYPDVYLTSQGDNKLQTLTAGPGQPTYRDIALRRGVTAARPFTGGDPLPSTAWHPEFQDVNNDGFIDLFLTKGNVNVMPDYAAKDPSNLMLGQPDGTFVEAADAAGIVTFARGRGAAVVDFNLDGLLDLVQVNLGAPVIVWRNVGSGTETASAPLGHWLALRLVQPGANRDAVGAWIEVRVGDVVMRRELTVGGGHIGGQAGWIHFGLGPAGRAEVRVQWPNGETGPWIPVAADGFAFIDRGSTAPRPWSPTSESE
ncbi:MAG TPA: CRTAC1 family protein [Candidatus Limnocylindrales bacterium]|nr:CRTAC1 family protein [Candidatus Limnocylindrales bacterium]